MNQPLFKSNLEEARFYEHLAKDFLMRAKLRFESFDLNGAEKQAEGAREAIRHRDVALLCHATINKVVHGAP